MNKKGSISMIMIAVYVSLIITSFYIILVRHSMFLEKKNNTDFAINNASIVNTDMIKTDFYNWKTIFNSLLEENGENTNINYMYMLEKSDDNFSIYDLNGNTVVQLGDLLSAEQMLNIISAYIKNDSTINKIQNFASSKCNKTCIVINKNITQKINKDYVITNNDQIEQKGR